MATEPTGRPTNFIAPPSIGKPRSRGDRPLAIATAVVFLISSVFPVVGGFVKDREAWPKWWGVLDVGIAFVLGVLAFAVIGFGQRKVNKQAEDASYRAYRFLLHGVFAMMLVSVLAGDRIVWRNCLTGFAWRYWLLLYGLPAWFALFRTTAAFRGTHERSEAP
jgi:hypothetical protein